MSRPNFYLPIIVVLIAILGCTLPGTIQPSQTPTQIPAVPVATTTDTPEMVIPTDTVKPIPPTETATETARFGTVNGKLSYPSEFIPAQRVILYVASNFTQYYSVDTVVNQSTYTIQVPEGTYYVVTYVIDSPLSAGYTAAVPCGLSVDCTDHSLTPVIVTSGETLDDINPTDWYAPQGSFPSKP